MSPVRRRSVSALALLAATAGCSSTYYAVMEKFGVEKRHLMVDRVEEARDEQQEAKEQFKTTLERMRELTGVEPGELEETYERLADDYERSKDRAEAVREKIADVEEVAGDMFAEWEEEIGQMQNANLRRQSEDLLDETRARYAPMLAAMKEAEERMQPVLQAFNDQVLFLKHNLNARAVAQLEGTVLEIEEEVEALITQMERSIDEANQFIDTMGQAST